MRRGGGDIEGLSGEGRFDSGGASCGPPAAFAPLDACGWENALALLCAGAGPFGAFCPSDCAGAEGFGSV